MARRLMSRALLCAAALLAATATAQPLVWRVAGGGTTHFVAGSVHALHDSDSALPPAYLDAYAATAQLVLEVDISETDGGRARTIALAAGKLPRGKTLCAVLGPKDCAEAERRAKAADLSLRRVARYEPWLAALTLTAEGMRQLGLDAGLGVDRQLAQRALADRRPVLGLETAADQFAAFDGLTPATQKRLLLDSLSELPKMPTELAAILTAWRDGDIATLAKQNDDLGEAPDLHRALFAERHARWLPQLEKIFASTTPTLVVVGAQHLVGADSILLALERAGFAPQRVD